MLTCGDVFFFLNRFAPVESQMGFDNSGFLIGRRSAQVNKVLLSLDVTTSVVKEAIEEKAQLIISHHPVIFNSLKSVTDEKLLLLVENNISVISMHTNLDIAEGGVNDVLLALLGADNKGILDKDGCGRIGSLSKEITLKSFLDICRRKLHTNGLRYYDAGLPVQHIAVMGGAGADCIKDAAEKGCDTYITSDIKYHQFLLAQELGINLIDGDHFGTEDPVIPVLRARLAVEFPDIKFVISKRHGPAVKFLM